MDEYSDDVQYGHLPMEDAKKISNKDLKKAFSQLLEKSRFPPQPVAECRFERCQHARRAVYPADPEFKELVRVCCDVGCTVTYHVSCWKQARKEVASWDGDKEALVCPTPDCNGLILFIETVDLDGEVKTKHELKRHKMFLEEKEKKKVASKAKPKEKPPSKPKEKMGRRKTKSESETTQVVREPLDIKPAIREEPKVEVAVAPATQALPVRQPSAYVAKLDTRSPWTDECIVLNKKGAHIGGPKEMRPVSTESVDATSTVASDELIRAERDNLLSLFASFLRRNGGAVHKNSCLIELFIKELPAQLQAIIFCESSLDSLIELAFDRFAIVDDHFVLLEDAGKPPAEEETLGVEQVQELQHELQRLTVTAREAAQQDEWARKSDKLLRLVVQSQQQVKEKDDQLEHLRLSHQHAERTSEQTIAGLKQTLLQSEVRRLRSEMKGALKVYQREVEEGRTVLAHCSQLHEVFPSLEYDLADCANQWSLYVQQLLEKMSLMDTLYLAWIQAVESGEITSDNPVWVEEPPPRPHGSATVLSKWLHIALTMKPPVQQNPLPPVYPEPAPGSMDKLEYIISRVSIEHPFLSRAQIMSHVMKLKSVSTVPLAQLDRDQVVKLVKELIMQEGGTQEEDSFCAVCQNVFVSCHEMTVTLECSHKFHYKCVEQWLFIHKACPSCRAIIKL